MIFPIVDTDGLMVFQTLIIYSIFHHPSNVHVLGETRSRVLGTADQGLAGGIGRGHGSSKKKTGHRKGH